MGEILPKFPRTFPPVIVVQHLAAKFLDSLVERMNSICKNKVRLARDGEQVKPNTIYFAPGGLHLEFDKIGKNFIKIRLSDDPPQNFVKPSVDVTLHSAVMAWGAKIIAVILTGMGHDGMNGCKLVKDAGGFVIAQDEPSSIIYGMNKSVIDSNLADVVANPESLVTMIKLYLNKLG